MDKNKLVLPITILLASIILGGFYFASQVNKQMSIERQQELKLEQEHREYVAKRRIECFEVYERERDRYKRGSVVSNFYNEKKDVCEISYRNDKYNKAICDEILKKIKKYENNNLILPFDLWISREEHCNKHFTKEF